MEVRSCSNFIVCCGLALLAHQPLARAASAEVAERPPLHRYALIVAVSEYPNLPRADWLHGPRNDALLVRQALIGSGVPGANITVLADGVEGAASLPERQAILRSLETLATRVSAGDFVFIYFSGHGSQQPARGDDEPDGLDEIFLPRDIGTWDGKTGAVRNAISDNEIGEHIARLRSRGAAVWAVFDSCHSGTMTRGVQPEDEHDRRVDMATLGVPAAAQHRTGAASDIDRGIDEREAARGDYVAFFAAQTTETAPELRLPENDPNRKTRGLLTYALVRALSSGTALTYRQVAQSILQFYRDENRTTPTPLFDGNLDGALFGERRERAVQQWPVRRIDTNIQVAGGLLHELRDTAVLEIVPTPLARDDETLGYIEITHAAMTTSGAAWLTDAARLKRAGIAPALAARKPAAEIPAGAYARLVSQPISFSLRVAQPRLCSTDPKGPCAGGQGSDRDLMRARSLLRTSALPGVRIVDATAPADVIPFVHQGRLWFAPPNGELRLTGPQATFSVPLASDATAAAAVRDALVQIARALNLTRLAGEFGTQSKLLVTLTVQRAQTAAREEISLQSVPQLRIGDRLTFRLQNTGDQPIDTTLLLLDSRYGVKAVFPAALESNRLEPHAVKVVSGEILQSAASGRETMLVIAVPAQPQAEPADFSYLAQRALGARRGAPRTPLTDLFDAAGFGAGPLARGGFPAIDAGAVAMMQYAWNAIE